MAPNIFITREIPQPAIDALKQEGFTVDVYPEDQVIPHEVLLNEVRERDGILCILTDTMDQSVFAQANRAKIIANYAVGFNNIDVAEATKRGIAITNTPGVLTDSTADLAWALLFATARNLVQSDLFLREGKFKGWGPMHFLGMDITGQTLGVIGMGRIGKAFAQRADAFRMKLLYTSRRRDEEFEQSYRSGAQHVDLQTLLSHSDFVSVHLPLTKETTHYIGETELKSMKSSAILINTARGPVVEEQALVNALKNRWIWGAGLDVFEEEPAVHPELIHCPQTTLLPHIGSATLETRTKMGLMAAKNLIAYFKGEKPANLVNPEVWPSS